VKKIRIKNLRSLQDTYDVDIKPLTVLVGRNSSGKSTFLRFFPLMKQTVETRTHEPILWYSSRYVDFGSFEESINSVATNKTISFEFEFELPMYTLDFYVRRRRPRSVWLRSKYRIDQDSFATCRINIEINEKFMNKMVFTVKDHVVEVTLFDKEYAQLTLNGTTYDDNMVVVEHARGLATFLPRIVFNIGNEAVFCEDYFGKKLFQKLKSMAHGSTKDETIEEFIDALSFGDAQYILDSMKRQQTTATSLLEKLRTLTLEDATFKQLRDFVVGMHINEIIEASNEYLQLYFTSVRYIAPVRASAERYYRIQGLSVDEIDPRGENIPMVLHHMEQHEKDELNDWLRDNFNFEVTTEYSGGHTSIGIKYSNTDNINLADTGFGYSQILPIILVLWQTTRKAKRNARRVLPNSSIFRPDHGSMVTLAIEQPELHLHPALQAKLVDAFVKVIEMCMEKNIDISIIIETHSETILNRIGYLMAKKYHGFNDKLVNVLIFDNTDDPRITKVRRSGYSKDGYLVDWPIGFFSPEGI
jgi:predicted ATPase